MILLLCPKFLRCLTADAGNFDRGHSLTSLPLPLAALSSLPTSARTKFFPHPRQGTRALPYKTVVGRPPNIPPHTKTSPLFFPAPCFAPANVL